MDTGNGNILNGFTDLKSKAEVAEYLGGSLKNLSYVFYVLPKEKQYKTFSITKRNGKKRTINAPVSSIRLYQKRLAEILSGFYKRKPCVHGYAKGCSIKSNAKIHCRKKWVVNIDLKVFFPSIHFGRVRGMFLSQPFEFNGTVATTLAQICCFEGALPQGAATSPIISNFICRRLDNDLISFAKKHRLTYSRYADDITFSTNLPALPESVGTIASDGSLELSDDLRRLIEKNSFNINESKIRYSDRHNRQEVTGLTVNEKTNVRRTYVRRVRAMLHAWQQYGLKDAAREHFEKYSDKVMPEYPELTFSRIATGRIRFIRQIKGPDDHVYRNMFRQIKALDASIKLDLPAFFNTPDGCNAVVLCEGKTDGLHLQAALRYFIGKGEFTGLKIYFHRYPDKMDINNSILYKCCETSVTRQSNILRICLFDRDDRTFMKKCREGDSLYKDWGNRLYSCVLPQPEHRDFSEVCIEHFYSDEVLRTKSPKGRRIYLSNEFDPGTGKHLSEDLTCRKRTDASCCYPKIIDSGVFKPNGDNVALSKNDFANLIFNREGDFADISFEHFRPVFELLSEIIEKDGALKEKLRASSSA